MKISLLTNSLPNPKTEPVDYVFAVDVSGSMWDELVNIRADLPNVIATNLKPGDSLTIMYYSGEGQFGTVLERFKMVNATGLSLIKNAVDSYLQPIGLTSFTEPLQAIVDFDSPNPYVVFMTDGHENCGGRVMVLELCKKLKTNNIHFIEYGPYADHDLLSKMAELTGGTLSYSQDFSSFESKVVRHLNSFAVSSSEIELPGADMVFGIISGEIMILNGVNGKFRVPEGMAFYSVFKSGVWDSKTHTGVVLQAMYCYALLGDSTQVWDFIKRLKSVYLAKKYNKAIGKVALNQFLEKLKYIISNDIDAIYCEGKEAGLAPKKNQFCILDLFDLLSDHDATFITRGEHFQYKRTTAKREIAAPQSVITASDKLSAAQAVKSAVHFTETEPAYCNFKQLEYNTERANISIKAKYGGVVDLSNHPENKYDIKLFPTYTYRQYVIVKDGLVHMPVLHVALLQEHSSILAGVKHEDLEDGTFLIYLDSIPVTNRKRMESITSGALCTTACQRLVLQAAAKVEKYNKSKASVKSPGFIEQFGQEATDFLSSVGITEHNGFSPSTVKGEVRDIYFAPTIEVKVKGFSSLPSIEKVMAKGSDKLTPSESLISRALSQDVSGATIAKNNSDRVLGQMIFSALLSKAQFGDDPITTKLGIDEFTCTIQQREIEVQI